MHKTKESSAKPSKSHDQNIRDADEMATEENYEAVGGETSTEGVGRGYDADGPDASADEKAESTADGPFRSAFNISEEKETYRKRSSTCG